MATIKELAQAYQPKTAKNITELKVISVDFEVKLQTGEDDQGKTYSYNYIEVNGEKYRVPDSVLSALKQILEKKPSLKTYAVSKSGEGRQTKYTVIPLD